MEKLKLELRIIVVCQIFFLLLGIWLIQQERLFEVYAGWFHIILASIFGGINIKILISWEK